MAFDLRSGRIITIRCLLNDGIRDAALIAGDYVLAMAVLENTDLRSHDPGDVRRTVQERGGELNV